MFSFLISFKLFLLILKTHISINPVQVLLVYLLLTPVTSGLGNINRFVVAAKSELIQFISRLIRGALILPKGFQEAPGSCFRN